MEIHQNNHREKLEQCIELLRENKLLQRENLWANIYRDTIQQSEWFLNPAMSPGRWAAGYPFLYALYRVLNEFRPCNILELGLGQTTAMITQYVALNPKVHHIVIEHDPQWISFFSKNHIMADNTDVIQLPVATNAVYKNDNQVVAYQGLLEVVAGLKFDLICIDGPFGYMAKQYSRVDVLKLMPDCLMESFIILLDDSNRAAEKNTISEMKSVLDQAVIPYKTGEYRGEKSTYMFASEDARFFCSM